MTSHASRLVHGDHIQVLVYHRDLERRVRAWGPFVWLDITHDLDVLTLADLMALLSSSPFDSHATSIEELPHDATRSPWEGLDEEAIESQSVVLPIDVKPVSALGHGTNIH